MSFQSVFLLPLIALALVVFQPIFKKHYMPSSSLKSRRYRKIILGRVVVAVLLLATLATMIWPIEGLISLVQGVVMAAAVLVPLYLLNGLYSMRVGNQRKQVAVAGGRDRVEKDIEKSKPEKPAVQITGRTKRRRGTAARNSTDAVSLHQRVAPRRTENAVSSAGMAIDSLSSVPHQGSGDNDDSPAEVQDQLDRVGDMVQSYDLDDAAIANSDEEDARQKIRDTHDQQSAISTELMTTDSSGTDLAQMSTSEVTQLVTNLRQSKMRLQKLVIAQQAAMDTERRAHDQSRTVARDAIKIMRDSRQAQKTAEKLARRERTERQRIELKYKEVAGALENAKSIIAQRNRAAQAAGKPVVSATPANDRDMLDDILA